MSNLDSITSTNRSEVLDNQVHTYNDRYEYRRKDLLGEGSFGCVYKCRDNKTNEMYIFYFISTAIFYSF